MSLLLAGYDDNGPQLYQIDPSGSYFAWKASAIGKNMTNAKTFLEKRYNEEVALEDAIHTALLTLKEGFEGQVSGANIEVRGRWVCQAIHPVKAAAIVEPCWLHPPAVFGAVDCMVWISIAVQCSLVVAGILLTNLF